MLNHYVIVVCFITLLFPLTSQATIVRLTTSVGDIDINLYDELTPVTVENFLLYVDSEAYDDSFFHRYVTGYIAQSGGFVYAQETGVQNIHTAQAISNEPFFSNIRGTIAMAKVGNNPNSATSQWFINLDNNASNLDFQNSGFTVFGEVMLDDMDHIDTLSQLDVFNFGGALASLPLRDYTREDVVNEVEVTHEHLVMISSIRVIDDAIDTLGGAAPVPTSFVSSGGGNTNDGGGMFDRRPLWCLFILLVCVTLRKQGYSLKMKI